MTLIKTYNDYFDTESYLLFVYITFFNLINYTFTYNIFKYFDKFNKLDYNKQIYIVKNIVKSTIMFYLVIEIYYYILPNMILSDNWNDKTIRYYGAIYASTDASALIIVPKLPFTTKFHHSCTIILYTLICFISVENNDLSKIIVCYTIFSCIPFTVNLYLALRFFYIKEEKKNLYDHKINLFIDFIRISAYYIYLITCFINWSININFFKNKIINNQFTWWYSLYLMFIIPIVNDDLVLLSWLKNKRILM